MSRALFSRSCLVVLLVSLAWAFAPSSAPGRASAQAALPEYAPGEVLIAWQPGAGPVRVVVRSQTGPMRGDGLQGEQQAAVQDISRATGLGVLHARPEHGLARLRVRAGREMEEIRRLKALGWVQFAEPNYSAYAADDGSTAPIAAAGYGFYPNDPEFGRQWYLHRIDAPEAWSALWGSTSFRVAVLDTGVAQRHPEFADKLLMQHAWNYLTNKPGAEDDDPQSHGTHVTGILAANMGNSYGIAGLAPDVRILPLKVLDSRRAGNYDDIAEAIYDATDLGAQVINMSLVGFADSQILRGAVGYAQARGVLLVAAAGNCGQANCGGINPNIYPAAYEGVVAVAASDRFDRTTPYSGYKPYIALAAPGGVIDEQIWSTTRSGFGPLYGTSMSTPLVSAAAALVWTLRPAAEPQEIAEILKSTADKVGTYSSTGEPLSYTGGRNDYFGAGRLNVNNAVRWVYPQSFTPFGARQNLSFLVSADHPSQTKDIELVNLSSQPVYWQASVITGTTWLTVTPSGSTLYDSPSQMTIRVEKGELTPGVYQGLVRLGGVPPADVQSFDFRVQLHVVTETLSLHLPIAQRAHISWLDPDAPGSLSRTVLTPADDTLTPAALPFPAWFYNGAYESMHISDNGYVLFGSADARSAQTPVACPGSGAAPNNAAYVLAYDWDPALGDEIVLHQPDTETYVVTWRGVRRSVATPANTFQLVIRRNGQFHASYFQVESPVPGIIGTESYDAAFSETVICNGAGRQVKTGEGVELQPRLPW